MGCPGQFLHSPCLAPQLGWLEELRANPRKLEGLVQDGGEMRSIFGEDQKKILKVKGSFRVGQDPKGNSKF